MYLTQACCQEKGDERANEIEKHILACIDFVAAEAVNVFLDLCFSRAGQKITGNKH